MNELSIIPFVEENGTEPFTDWILDLDSISRKRILTRLTRIQTGNFGDCKRIDDAIYELRFFFGNGYRVYFGKDDENIVLLLCGGIKDTQNKDITNAKRYWRQYNEQKNKKNK